MPRTVRLQTLTNFLGDAVDLLWLEAQHFTFFLPQRRFVFVALVQLSLIPLLQQLHRMAMLVFLRAQLCSGEQIAGKFFARLLSFHIPQTVV